MIMPQSLARIAQHLVFSVGDREPVFVLPVMRTTTAQYMAGILRNLECNSIRVGVVADHVHVLHIMSRTRTVADVVGALKRETSEWIKTQPWARGRGALGQCRWQRGYGVFSVSHSRVQSVIEYIDAQQEHHRAATFQDEYRQFMARHGLVIDERYVWD
jgi:REP element-mobilizing transposase RayT